MKKCTKCGDVKGLECFGKHQKSKDGYQPWCKKCNNKYYEENKEKIISQQRLYKEKNKKKINERKRKWLEKYKQNPINKEKISKRFKKFYEKNKEKIISQQRLYNKNNIDKINEYKRKYNNELTKHYICRVLQINISQLTPDLYELKREQLQIKRLTKQLTEEIKNVHE